MVLSQAEKLLSLVPPILQDQVSLYWQDWVSACEAGGLEPSIDYDLARVGKVWACSDFIARTCIRFPEMLFDLIADIDSPRSMSDYQQIVQQALDIPFDEDKVMQQLRRLRQKEMMRIAWRDLDELTEQQQILNEISDLAEAIVAETLECMHKEQATVFGNPLDREGNPQNMLILGMGKMGGRELNFSSDIDLIFCYPEDGETEGPRRKSNHEFFVRVAQALVRVLNDVTKDGFVYRVDTRLRPYGNSGPLVSSFSALESYYQQQGRDWERYAMIKAKVITGSEGDRDYLRSMLKPFIYRRYLDYSAFESIREMKSMINAEVKRKGIENNIKLGRGGIREIEFIGQTFQMIRGGRDIALQERGIMKILTTLAEMNILDGVDVDDLKTAYEFHRKVENSLQMERDAQTHLIPVDEINRHKLMLAMNAGSWEQLAEDIEKHRVAVDRVFQSIMFAEESETTSDDALNAFWFDAEMENDVDGLFCEWLTGLGIDEPAAIVTSLGSFRKDSHIKVLSEDAVKRLIKLLTNILSRLNAVTEQAAVFDRLLGVLLSIVGRQVYINLLVEYPQVLDLVVSLCDRSDWFAQQLARYPILLDELIDAEYLHSISGREELATELSCLFSSISPDDLEQQMVRLRHFRQAQVLKVASLDVKDKVEVTEVSDTLTSVAEVICEKALELVWNQLVEKHGLPECVVDGERRQASIGIIAYGKMGGRELSYSSDLDVVFVHNSEGEKQMTSGDKCIDNASFFARVAQKFIHIMETFMHGGRLYEIDTRLRPNGESGLMTVSLKSFEQYQKEQAWTWEHQALVRARMIAGDELIQQEFGKIRQSVLQQPRSYEKILTDVVEMREKMRDHLGSKDGSSFHIKQDAGGLVDIEFIAQAGVLCKASECPRLLETTSTLQLLTLMPKCDWLAQSEAETLISAYRDYRLVLNRQALDVVFEKDRTGQSIEDVLEKHRAQVTQIWQRVILRD